MSAVNHGRRSWMDQLLVPAALFMVLQAAPTWLLLTLLTIALYFIYGMQGFWVFHALNIPGPTPWPVVGTLWQVYIKGIRKSDLDNIRKYGPIVGTYEGRTPTLIVSDPVLLKKILIKDFKSFPDRRTAGLDEYPIRRAITCLRGNHWKHVRCKVTPFFSSAKLKAISPRIHECASTLVRNIRKASRGHQPVQLKGLCGAFAMDVIATAAFDLKVDSLNDASNPFVRYAEKVFNYAIPQPVMLLLLFFPSCIHFLKKLGLLFFPGDAKEFFMGVINSALSQRAQSKEAHNDFLQLMLNARVNGVADGINGTTELPAGFAHGPDGIYTTIGLTHEEVLAQSLIFFLAGYETTATTLALTMYCLATYPEYQEIVRQEILDTGLHAEDMPSSDQLSKLTYLELCILETLRIYPTATRVTRICSRDTFIGPYRVYRGTVIAIPIYALHHDPEAWPNPETFQPERFSPGEQASQNALNYVPFGAGPRSCVGTRMAMLELKMALVSILLNFRIRTCAQTQMPLRLTRRAILQTERGVVLHLDDLDTDRAR